MTDRALSPRAAFHGHLDPGRSGADHGGAGIVARPRDDQALVAVVALRGRLSALAGKVEALFGLALPPGPKRVSAGGIAFIGTGPEQWLAVAGGSAAREFPTRLADELAGLAAVADQSDASAVIRIGGPRTRDMLAKGLPIDLHPSVFGPGDAASSMVALIEAQLWQIDATPCYEIAISRSLAGSFAQWLIESGAEYGIDILP